MKQRIALDELDTSQASEQITGERPPEEKKEKGGQINRNQQDKKQEKTPEKSSRTSQKTDSPKKDNRNRSAETSADRKPKNSPQQKKEAEPKVRPRAVPSVPVRTVYINDTVVEKLVKRKVAKTVSSKLNAGYTVVKIDELEKLKERAERAAEVAADTQVLDEPKRYYMIRRKTGEVTDINEGEMKIGIGDSCDYIVRDTKIVSREHAVIKLIDGKLTIRDIGSTNHTYINGTRIPVHQDVEIMEGHNIKLGNEMFSIEVY